jgi:hypothetical protein
VLDPLRASGEPISPDIYLRTPALLVGQTLRLANATDPDRRADLEVAAARYDDESSALVLVAGNGLPPLGEVVAKLGGAGAVEFALGPAGMPRIGSVRLPNSVGFASIFAGKSASTPELVAHYRAWTQAHPKEAAAIHRRLSATAEAGCKAARGNAAGAFIEAIASEWLDEHDAKPCEPGRSLPIRAKGFAAIHPVERHKHARWLNSERLILPGRGCSFRYQGVAHHT